MLCKIILIYILNVNVTFLKLRFMHKLFENLESGGAEKI